MTVSFSTRSRRVSVRGQNQTGEQTKSTALQVSALVVDSDAQMLHRLQAALRDQRVTTRCAGTCEEARAAIIREGPPDVIFAGTSFPDGTWRDVLRIAKQANPWAGVVIVTTGLEDIGLCLDAPEEGAADLYIVPPFAASDITHVVRCAIQDVIHGDFGGHPADSAAVRC